MIPARQDSPANKGRGGSAPDGSNSAHSLQPTIAETAASLGSREPVDLTQGIVAISRLTRDELIDRWRAACGQYPPKGISSRLLQRAAAYHLQAHAFGGLKRGTVRALRRRADVPVDRTGRRSAPCRLNAGTRLVRTWNGRTHTVEVTETGFLWNGAHWPSLSAVARAITSARWSGPRFFGL